MSAPAIVRSPREAWLAEPARIAMRFWLKVERRGPDECWPYLGACFDKGYGAFSINGRNRHASRVAWELTHGPIEPGQGALHRCDVRYPVGSIEYRKCCNPAHLFLGTVADNAADMVAKGRQAKGDRNGSRLHPERLPRGDRHGLRAHPEKAAHGTRNGAYTHPERVLRGEKVGTAKLSDDQADWLRRAVGPRLSIQDAAWLLGVHRTLVWQILRGKCRVARTAQ